ncbi:MAG: hypothetical protein PVI26_00570 [Chitinispirillia bacterium]|jgi:hypothetical protein
MKKKQQSGQLIVTKVLKFIESCKGSAFGEYRMWTDGQITLYSSCFAAMLYHYVGELKKLNDENRQGWINYIQQYQEPKTGLFIGPEINPSELTSSYHNYDHVTMHLTAHVLPTINLLGGKPRYSLRFAHRFMDKKFLLKWFEKIDWRDAWLRGNDLLFVGQFLIYLRNIEKESDAQPALDLYFQWLDSQIDKRTGLWGTNGFCNHYNALYGGYHQLLVYYFCKHDLPFASRTIDTTLRLQHPDGSFTPDGGGGACEDVDAVDILVNMYKYTGYRNRAISFALNLILNSILKTQMSDGGFVYRRGIPFTHMGITKTSSPPDHSNLFATWFRIHTIALCCQILIDHPLAKFDWQFNHTCSMGWHRKETLPERIVNPWYDYIPFKIYSLKNYIKISKIMQKFGSVLTRIKSRYYEAIN